MRTGTTLEKMFETCSKIYFRTKSNDSPTYVIEKLQNGDYLISKFNQFHVSVDRIEGDIIYYYTYIFDSEISGTLTVGNSIEITKTE